MSIKIKQIEVDSNFNINNFRIVNLSDPTDNTDAVNFQTLKTMISGITTGITSLGDLSDVDISNIENYEILMFSGGTWVNSKDIILPNDSKIHIGDWRISELTGNLKIEKNVGGNWELGAEFYIE
jgi:hypothetical protein